MLYSCLKTAVGNICFLSFQTNNFFLKFIVPFQLQRESFVTTFKNWHIVPLASFVGLEEILEKSVRSNKKYFKNIKFWWYL